MTYTTPPKVVAVGHRGCRDLLPENTLAAFKHALEMGVDAIELDVHLSVDGKVMVYHDYFLNPSLTRTSQGTWIEKSNKPLHTQTFQELRLYKLGQIKPNSDYATQHPNTKNTSDEPIPTLVDVLELMIHYPKARLFIEVKTTPVTPEISSDPALITKAVVEAIQHSGIKERCVLLAFDWAVMKGARELDPQIQLYFNQAKEMESNPLWFGGYYITEFQNSAPTLIAHMGGGGWSAEYRQLNKEIIKHAHDCGLKVYAWTVNSANDMQRLIDWDVDGIITDRPDVLLDLLGRS